MSNGPLVFWVVLDLFLAALVLLVAGGTVALYRAGHRRLSGRPQRTASGTSLALYAVGLEAGLALPLAATLAQTFRALGALPHQLPTEATHWIVALVLSAVVLSALSLLLGLVLKWRAGRRSRSAG